MASKPSSLVTDLQSAESTPFQAFSPSRGSVRGGTTEPWRNSVSGSRGWVKLTKHWCIGFCWISLLVLFLEMYMYTRVLGSPLPLLRANPFALPSCSRIIPSATTMLHVRQHVAQGSLQTFTFHNGILGDEMSHPTLFIGASPIWPNLKLPGSIDDFGARRFRRTLCLMVRFWWSSTFCCVSWRCRWVGLREWHQMEFTKDILGALWQRDFVPI